MCSCSSEHEEEGPATRVRPTRIIDIADPAGELKRVFPGVVIPAEDTLLSFRVGGRLATLPAGSQVGALVEAGAPLATLDPTDFENALANAEASFELAQAQFNRAMQLIKDGYISQTEHDRLRARYRSKSAELSQARTNLAYTELQAPFQGRVARVLVKNFESVAADQPIAVLEDAAKVDVEIQVSTAFLAQIPAEAKAGYRAGASDQSYYEIEFENAPGQRFTASISEMETQPDPGTLTYRTVVSMPVPDGTEILAGLNARVYVDLAQLADIEPRIYIPEAALFTPDEQPALADNAYVWRVDPKADTVSMQRVKLGSLTPYGVVVLDGLVPGDRIVGAGVQLLREGARVRPLLREPGL